MSDVYPDLAEASYHADPALSASGAKLILKSPAHYRYDRDHPEPVNYDYDLGHAFHARVLGVGAPVARLEFPDRRTKAYKEEAALARAAGMVPMLAADDDAVLAMVEAVRSHPTARWLLSEGKPEVSLFWDDEDETPWRARIDWLRNDGLIVDVKSTVDAGREAFSRALWNFGYCTQAATYTEGVRATEIHHEPAFIFLVVDKDPPHLIALYEPDEEALELGRAQMRRAAALYRECMETGEWPGYSTKIQTLSVPRWAARQYEETA